MLVTLFGIEMDVKPEQCEKAEGEIDTIPSFISIDVLSGIEPLYS